MSGWGNVRKKCVCITFPCRIRSGYLPKESVTPHRLTEDQIHVHPVVAWFLLCWVCRMWPDCLTKLMTGINRALLVSNSAMPYANLSSLILMSPWKPTQYYYRLSAICCAVGNLWDSSLKNTVILNTRFSIIKGTVSLLLHVQGYCSLYGTRSRDKSSAHSIFDSLIGIQQDDAVYRFHLIQYFEFAWTER
jgi:hypothetical protein